MSSSMRASGSSTLYWSCAKYSLTTLWPRRTVPDGWRFDAGHQLDERRFACAVDADQRHAIAALDGEAPIAEEAAFRRSSLQGPSASTTMRPEGGGCGNLKWMTGSSSGISMRSIFSSSLMRDCTCLALVACVAEAVDESFKMFDLVALVAPGGLKLRAPLIFLREVFRDSCPGRW